MSPDDEQSTNQSGDESDSASTGDSSDGDDGDSSGTIHALEKVLAVVGVVLAVSLVSIALWQAATSPTTATPELRVVGAEETASSVVFEVQITNPMDVGLEEATVRATCTDPPSEVSFRHVPAGGQRTAHVRCPAGSTDPELSVLTWQAQ